MGHDDVGALLDHVDDVLGGVLHELELLLRGVAEGVAAQGDDSGLAVALFVSHRFHLNLSVNQPTKAQPSFTAVGRLPYF